MARPKSTRRIPAKMIAALKEAREAATFSRAGFFTFEPDAAKLDAELKERTRLYRETWIIARIDQVIAWAENTPDTDD